MSSGVTRLAPVSELAVAMIAFLAGAELRWEEVRARGVVLGKIMTAELVFSFVALTATLMATVIDGVLTQSLPWALVFVDGKSIGQTPLRKEIPSGSHRIRLKNGNTGQTKTHRIHLKRGATESIRERW